MSIPSFWAMPTPAQSWIASLIKPKDEYELKIFWSEKDQYWIFHMPPFIWNEGLLGGTELALNFWYQKLSGQPAKQGSKMKLKLTSFEPKQWDAKAYYIQDDPIWMEASEYWEPESKHQLWLCPMLQILFGSKPEWLWIGFQPIA